MAPGNETAEIVEARRLWRHPQDLRFAASLCLVLKLSSLRRLLDHEPERETVLHFNHRNRTIADAVQMIE